MCASAGDAEGSRSSVQQANDLLCVSDKSKLEKPSNWTFKSGQYLDMTLLDPSEMDAEGNVRSFSIASAPHKDTLMVATRMRDTAFKRVLDIMPLSCAVKIEEPSGSLTLNNNVKRTAAFLAGGIGITPFRNIVFGAAKKNLPHRIFLFYSNRRPEVLRFWMSSRLWNERIRTTN